MLNYFNPTCYLCDFRRTNALFQRKAIIFAKNLARSLLFSARRGTGNQRSPMLQSGNLGYFNKANKAIIAETIAVPTATSVPQFAFRGQYEFSKPL